MYLSVFEYECIIYIYYSEMEMLFVVFMFCDVFVLLYLMLFAFIYGQKIK